MLSKMTPGELVEFKRKEKEERNKRDIEVSNRIFLVQNIKHQY